jgi:hypothetical protein
MKWTVKSFSEPDGPMGIAERVLLVVLLLLATAAPASAQRPDLDARRGQASRAELQSLLDLYEKSAASPAYSDSLRARSRREADQIRDRLEEGDFQVGDRVTLSVENEPSLTETFIVTDGPILRLPLIRQVNLKGVLRSELEPNLRTQIARFEEDPVVRAQALIRIAIMGGVPRPGFYTPPSDMLLSDVLMQAGGPGTKLDNISVQRGGKTILTGEQIRDALTEGKTLDQLDVREGDLIKVPQGRGIMASIQGAFGWLSMLVTLPVTIFTVSRIL